MATFSWCHMYGEDDDDGGDDDSGVGGQGNDTGGYVAFCFCLERLFAATLLTFLAAATPRFMILASYWLWRPSLYFGIILTFTIDIIRTLPDMAMLRLQSPDSSNQRVHVKGG